MNRKTLFLLLLLCPALLAAQDNKPRIRVGGMLFFATYYDSYKSVDNRAGVSYSFPLPPDYDPDGKDLNEASQFGMSVYQSRFHITAEDFRLLNAEAKIFIETDFMGAGKEFCQMLRLRHAYADLRWKKDELLLGQTNNLMVAEEVIPGVLTAGMASPIMPLSRPVLLRYGRQLGTRLKLYAGAAYHTAMPFIGNAAVPSTLEAQRNAGYPDFHARLQYTVPGKLFIGVAGGYKMLRPRLKTEEEYRADATVGSGDVTAFLRWNFGRGWTFKAQGMYGGNLSCYNMIGGYGKLLGEPDDSDYGYTNLLSYSVWIDLESKAAKNFRLGLFAGYMENLGSVEPVDKEVVYARTPDLSASGRISPRVTYTWKGLLIGAEYSLFTADWGRMFDEYYLSTLNYETVKNNRVTLLFRYSF